jgi:ubiquinone/menaquinone biosynthesis C-methylase UbiE
MSATGEQTAPMGVETLKARLKTTWMAGNYDAFARFMEKGSRPFYEELGIPPGAHVLDVACGTGQLALIAARAGARVTGCDIATNWLEKARLRADAEGLTIAFDEGDAEMLPYADSRFDVVLSFFGAMFAPQPECVAAELIRVCRPGGIIAMANWTPQGFVGQMFRTISRHIAPSGMPSPVLWGDKSTVRQRLEDGVVALQTTPRVFLFEYSFSPWAVVDFFRANYGPMTRAFGSLDAPAQAELHRELVELWSTHNLAPQGLTCVEAEYLEVIATRA